MLDKLEHIIALRHMHPDAWRFWAKVNIPEDTTQCWEWATTSVSSGYGMYHYMGRAMGAHMVCWHLMYGEFPTKPYVIMHTCDNRLCVNPAHLQLGTHTENIQDALNKGRRMPAVLFLSSEEYTLIRAMYAEGNITQEQLADRFAVSTIAIQKVLNHKRKRAFTNGER